MQNQDMSLVLSSDAKPRLKWTPQLHQRFVNAITQLGGAEKATPKSLMRVMGVHGLTLYHLKSHLQKYRLGKSQESHSHSDNNQEDYSGNQGSHFSMDYSDETENQIDKSLQIAQALQMQMEVQRKLHEQIEVQRHLQLRIEAQGKYLQSVLKKAQDTLAGYGSSSLQVELAKAELSHLVSMVDNGCPSSSVSGLTEIGGTILRDIENKPLKSALCSHESSLTSPESSGRKEETQQKDDNGNSIVLSLMEMHSEEKSRSSNQGTGRKRSGSTISDGNCVEEQYGKRLATHKGQRGEQLRKFGLFENIDLNSQYMNEFELVPKE